jgi:hypothetical protein
MESLAVLLNQLCKDYKRTIAAAGESGKNKTQTGII